MLPQPGDQGQEAQAPLSHPKRGPSQGHLSTLSCCLSTSRAKHSSCPQSQPDSRQERQPGGSQGHPDPTSGSRPPGAHSTTAKTCWVHPEPQSFCPAKCPQAGQCRPYSGWPESSTQVMATSLSQEPLATRAPGQGTVLEGAPEKKVSRKRAAPSPSPGDTCTGSRHPHPSAQTLSVFLHPSVPPPPPRLAASRLMPVLSLRPRPYQPHTHSWRHWQARAKRGTEVAPIPHASQMVSLTTTHSPQPIHCLGVPPSQAPSHLGPHPPRSHQPHLPAALGVSEQLRFGDRQVAKAAVTVAATGVRVDLRHSTGPMLSVRAPPSTRQGTDQERGFREGPARESRQHC